MQFLSAVCSARTANTFMQVTQEKMFVCLRLLLCVLCKPCRDKITLQLIRRATTHSTILSFSKVVRTKRTTEWCMVQMCNAFIIHKYYVHRRRYTRNTLHCVLHCVLCTPPAGAETFTIHDVYIVYAVRRVNCCFCSSPFNSSIMKSQNGRIKMLLTFCHGRRRADKKRKRKNKTNLRRRHLMRMIM